MLTKHTKIKQLNTISKKSTSNNDLLLVEKTIQFTFENEHYQLAAIPQFIEFLIQGIAFLKHGKQNKLTLNNELSPNSYTIELKTAEYTLQQKAVDSLQIQPHELVEWVREFKSAQSLYHQTGASESVGVLLDTGEVFTIECIRFESAFAKLIGALIKKDVAYYPILFVSHRITADLAMQINLFKPAIIICQSAITDHALSLFVKNKQTVYGFCRKNKFNRYSNFHI